jgi:hypothetical protein
MQQKPSYSLWFICVYLMLSLSIGIGSMEWRKGWVLNWDNAGYHLYAPAIWIYKDVRQFQFYDQIDARYHPSGEVTQYAQQQVPFTNNKLIKYPVGVAIMQLPLFLVADFTVQLTNSFPRDGYSPPYQLAVVLSTIFACIIGLLFLRRFLLSYNGEAAVTFALIVLTLGTNLFYYTCMDQGLSHVYLFMLYAMILYYRQQWANRYSTKHALYLGACIGLATITRPTDIFILIPVLLWNMPSARISNINKRVFLSGATGILAFLVVVAIQLIYWKSITGRWIVDSYPGEHFDFTNWQIIPALFNLQRGWLMVTPLVILAWIGVVLLFRSPQFAFYRWPIIGYFSFTLYVLFCWWQWYYGGSYGCRVLLQSLALLALPLAVLWQYVQTRSVYLKGLLILLLCAGILHNIRGSIRYNKGMSNWSRQYLPGHTVSGSQ